MDCSWILAVCVFVVLLPISLQAQDSMGYQRPPQEIVDLVEAPTTPSVTFAQNGTLALLFEQPSYPSLQEVSQPILGLAGLRLNPISNSSAVTHFFSGIRIKNLQTGEEHSIEGLPIRPRIANTVLSPDESMLAFTHYGEDGMQLWVLEFSTRRATRISDRLLNDAYGTSVRWKPGGTSLLVNLIPEQRGSAPVADVVPTGPVIQENLGLTAPSRTYQNLLQNPHDEALFDHYLTSQLAYVDLDGGVRPVSSPAIYRSVSFSPDGQYLMVARVQRPYSYLVPVGSFPYELQLWSHEGDPVKTLFQYPLDEAANLVRDAVTPHPRMYGWRADRPASVYWVQALDEGDPKKEVSERDALYDWEAPFSTSPRRVWATDYRLGGIDWTGTDFALVTERWRTTRDERIRLVDLRKGEAIRIVSDRKSDDGYSDPGRFVQTKNQFGRNILLTEGRGDRMRVFTVGNGASPEGDRPFLMRWNLFSGKKDTLFKSAAPYYEVPVFFNNAGRFIISRESIDSPPNYFSVNLRNRKAEALTFFPHPYPSLKAISKREVAYRRADGLNLTGTLYLPAGFQNGDAPLPMLLWAYPREFESRAAADQIKGSPHRFTRISWGSPIYWVTRGYAVLDNADMPIVGSDGNEPNDSFVEQLEQNARAAIDFLAHDGIIDRQRVGVGGHSYGAFMTANLLAHTDLFAAGLARSGAYNRTFTPFGFQNERRTYWEAPDVYYRMSPFSYADQIKTPILLIHGADDENSGTFPIQSERLYNAIKGHGGVARLVFLPKEFHGYRAKESILHTLWEMDQWLEKYVKNRE